MARVQILNDDLDIREIVGESVRRLLPRAPKDLGRFLERFVKRGYLQDDDAHREYAAALYCYLTRQPLLSTVGEGEPFEASIRLLLRASRLSTTGRGRVALEQFVEAKKLVLAQRRLEERLADLRKMGATVVGFGSSPSQVLEDRPLDRAIDGRTARRTLGEIAKNYEGKLAASAKHAGAPTLPPMSAPEECGIELADVDAPRLEGLRVRVAGVTRRHFRKAFVPAAMASDIVARLVLGS